MESIKDILLNYNIIDKIYDRARIVDPRNKKVSGREALIKEDAVCYDFWNRGKICSNCISMRALNKNKTYMKLEYTGSKIFMVTAIPVENEGNRIIIELIKDVTDSLIFSCEGNADNLNLKRYIENINEIAFSDELTLLYNRRYVNDRLPVDILNCSMNRLPVSVIMADLDFFKNINDSYGHITGDLILKEFGKILKDSLRYGRDWAARFGGEEFLICLPGADSDKALKIAERIRKKVQNKIFSYEGNNFNITCSFGVCTKNEDISYLEFIECADKKLYTAKKTGRNKTVI